MAIKVGNTTIPTTEGSLKVGSTKITKVNVVKDGVTTTVWQVSSFSSKEFNYTGGVQAFTVPVTGTYLLEVKGARGGHVTNHIAGGFGGYAKGYANLTAGQTIYVCVGGQGTDCSQRGSEINTQPITYPGGYNGGANAPTVLYYNGSGGGCTHIGTFNSTLADHGSTNGLFIVAGGGGGASYHDDTHYGVGGTGGGTTGGNGTVIGDYVSDDYFSYGTGGTQTAGGYNDIGETPDLYRGFFGKANSDIHNSAGGGGGLYGGGPGGGWSGAGGGSGYIGGVTSGSMENGVRDGNGWAKITLV